MEIRRAMAPFSGDGQTRITLSLMKRLTYEALLSPDIIQTATDIVRNVSGHDTRGLAAAIDGWSRSHVGYLDDPIVQSGGDFLRTPDYVLLEIKHKGRARIDCDDAAMLTAALALSVGLVPRFHAVAFGDPSAPFQHVYTEVYTDAGWMPLDITSTGRQLPISRDMILEVV
jgi:transglutaminase-like putative cysteine protease